MSKNTPDEVNLLRGEIFASSDTTSSVEKMTRKIPKTLLSIIGPLFCIGLTTLLLRWTLPILDVQNIALLYLIPVMVCTVLWGLTAGLMTGFVSFLTFNFVFIKPYNTLLIHQSQDLITLTIFLVVAFVVSQLIGQARKAVLLARTRELEATRMYELISSLAGLSNFQAVAQTLSEKLIQIFHFDHIEIEIKEGKSEKKFQGGCPISEIPNHASDLIIEMKTKRDHEGAIHLWYQKGELNLGEKRLLEAYCDQGALAIERIRLSEGETRIRVLEESDRLKTSILNSVSHELRSPLAAIKASISSLRSGAVNWDHPARTELLTTVEEETDQLNHLVGNLLDMSRIESGSLNPHLRWNSISEIAMGVAKRMAIQIQNHSLKFDLPKDLPLIPSDYVMLEQVFTNLISNSVKYAPVGTQILISAEKEDNYLRVMIKNQSPSVDEENLDHIFEKFFRVTQADKVIGTGLGLSICKGIVEAHGGKIWAENIPEGFMFIFKLPLTLNGNLPEIPKEATDG